MSKPVDRALDAIRYKRDQAEAAWNERVKLIRENPNQMNIRGVWQADQLADLVRLHAIFTAFDTALVEAQRAARPRRSKP